MSRLQYFPLPDVGEGLTEAEILNWHVQPGDHVTVNQVIVEIETAKAAVELPCPYAGVVSELLAVPGQTVAVGSPIIVIDTGQEDANGAQPVGDDQAGAQPEGRVPNLVGYGPRASAVKRRVRKEQIIENNPVTPVADYVPLAKPPVRKLAKELGVDLSALAGSGPNGVITRNDVEHLTDTKVAQEKPVENPYDPQTREREVSIRGVRKATAQAMVRSAFTAPHVTEFLTVDVTPMMEFLDTLRSSREFRDLRLTPLVVAAKAVCLAIRRTPDVNATWDESGEKIVYKDYVHLGIAADTPRGLIVPKLRDVDAMSLRDIAVGLDQLVSTARAGKTSPADLVNGTITITNIGVFGIDTGTPIINPGESAILALGAIREMPWVVGGQVVPRQVCQLSLSFDHRVVDGAQGSRFLADVGALFANPAMALAY